MTWCLRWLHDSPDSIRKMDPIQQTAIQKHQAGSHLLNSVLGTQEHRPGFEHRVGCGEVQSPRRPQCEPPEPTEEQVVEVERQQMATALKASTIQAA